MRKKEGVISSVIDYLDDIVSVEVLSKIFLKSFDRGLFISEYKYFGQDGNDDFYKKFIEKHIYNNRSKAQEDCIELTIVLQYYKINHFLVIKNIMFSRRSELLKLLCLDWVFEFNKLIPLQEFKEVNKIILEKSDENLVRIQALLNLLLNKWDINIYNKFKNELIDVKYGAVYYRVLNVLKSDIFNQKLTYDINQDVMLAINSNKNLQDDQRQELLNEVRMIEIRRNDNKAKN